MVLLDELALQVALTWKKLSTLLSHVVVHVAFALVGARSPTGGLRPVQTTMPDDVIVALPLPTPAAVMMMFSDSSNTVLAAALSVGMAALIPITVPNGGAKLSADIAVEPSRTVNLYVGVPVLLRMPRPVRRNWRPTWVKSKIGCHSTGWLKPVRSEASLVKLASAVKSV